MNYKSKQNLKFKISNLKLERRALPGATLLMSLLILSLLTAVGTGFGVLILGQIRAARSFDNAVVAELIAQTRAEEVMYLLRKENRVVTFGGGCPPDYDNEPTYENGGASDCRLVGQNSVTVDLAENDATQFDLFANNVLGNNPLIHGLRISFNDQVPLNGIYPNLEIFIWSLRNDSGFKIESGQGLFNDINDGYRLVAGTDYLSSPIVLRFNDNGYACENRTFNACVFKTEDAGNKVVHKNFIQSGLQGYRVRIKSLKNSFSQVKVEPLNDIGQADTSLYFPSPVKIKVTGIYREAKFTEEITVSTRPSLSGLFDYSLFSQDDIVK